MAKRKRDSASPIKLGQDSDGLNAVGELRNMFRNAPDFSLGVDVLKRGKNNLDIDDIEFLCQACNIQCYWDDRLISEQYFAFCSSALQAVEAWVKKLEGNIEEDGVPVNDPLRDELIDSAVAVLEDTRIGNRSVIDKVQFLEGKGLNRTEIRIALAQVGIEAPISLQVPGSLRKKVVDNGVALLSQESVKEKPIEESLAFLKSKGFSNSEIARVVEILELKENLTVEYLNNLNPYVPRAPRQDMIDNGVKFLHHESISSMSARKKLLFLQKKGLTVEELRRVCDFGGLHLSDDLKKEFFDSDADEKVKSNQDSSSSATEHFSHSTNLNDSQIQDIRDDIVAKGIKFLQHPVVQGRSAEEKAIVLRRKGLSDAEILKAFSGAGLHGEYVLDLVRSSNSDINSVQVDNAVRFLSHPSTQSRSLDEKIQFLRSKGLSKREVDSALKKVGISMNNTSAPADDLDRWLGEDFVADDEAKPVEKDSKTDLQNSEDFISESESRDENINQDIELKLSKKVREATQLLLKKSVSSLSTVNKVYYLLACQFTSNEIEEAFRAVGLAEASGSSSLPDSMVNISEKSPIVRFLRYVLDPRLSKESVQDKYRFLQAQGASKEQLKIVKEIIGQLSPDTSKDPSERKDRKSAGVRFLKNLESKNYSDWSQAVKALSRNGLTESEIHEVFSEAGVDFPSQSLLSKDLEEREAKIKSGIQFFIHPDTQGYSLEDKKAFLKSKGLAEDEIEEVCMSANEADSTKGDINKISKREPSRKTLAGARLLRDTSLSHYSLSEKASFLVSKGLSKDEVKEAFKLADVDLKDFDSALTRPGFQKNESKSKAVQFLRQTAKDYTTSEQRDFLRSKSYSDEEIDQAFISAGVRSSLTTPNSRQNSTDTAADHGAARENRLNQATKFLLDLGFDDTEWESRLRYLKDQGMSDDEIDIVVKRSRLDPRNINYVETLSNLRKSRFDIDENTDATGKVLQCAINTSVDVLKRLNDQSIAIAPKATKLWMKALGLLALALCRCRPYQVNRECVAFGVHELIASLSRKDLRDSAMCWFHSVDLEELNEFLVYIMEFAARSVQIDSYTRIVQNSKGRIFVCNPATLLKLISRLWWRDNRAAISFEQGIALARAIHGSFLPIAAFQSFSDVGGPAADYIVELLTADASRDEFQDIAAYLASGMLRGGMDYAWGKEVVKSPQTSLESALRGQCRSLLLLSETTKGDNSVDEANQKDIDGFVRALGFALVYCDSQLVWSVEIFMVVVESLLGDALFCKKLFGEDDRISLDQRIAAADHFVDTEMFKSSPLIVARIRSFLQGSNLRQSFNEVDSFSSSEYDLGAYMARRLRSFTFKIYSECQDSVVFRSVIGRHSVEFSYGNEEQSIKSEPAAATSTEDSSNEKNSRISDTQNVKGASLASYHNISRVLQMAYLSCIVIGSCCSETAEFDTCVILLDCLANLSAFQFRTQEAASLEDNLIARISSTGICHDQKNSDEMLFPALPIFFLLYRHLKQEDSVSIRTSTDDNSQTLPQFDWILGARIEFLCRLSEKWFLPLLISTSKKAVGFIDQNSTRDFELEDAFCFLDHQKPDGHSVKKILNPDGGVLVAETDSNESRLLFPNIMDLEKRDKLLSWFTLGLFKILLKFCIIHPFYHVNHLGHRWMTKVVSEVSNESHKSKEASSDEGLSVRLFYVPKYLLAVAEYFPWAPQSMSFFATASVFASLGSDPDPRAQAIGLLCFEALATEAGLYIKQERKFDTRSGPAFLKLLFTMLKVVSLPILPLVLKISTRLVRDSKKPIGDAATFMSNEWLLGCIFEVISRTEDVSRRHLLCLWYLRDMQNLSIGGNL